MPCLLIVEDERILRRHLASFFSRRGYDVVQAGSVREAERLIAASAIHGALLDVGLPDGSGLALVERVGGERSIVMTAFPDERALSTSGARHYLAKPLELDRLDAMVAEVTR